MTTTDTAIRAINAAIAKQATDAAKSEDATLLAAHALFEEVTKRYGLARSGVLLAKLHETLTDNIDMIALSAANAAAEKLNLNIQMGTHLTISPAVKSKLLKSAIELTMKQIDHHFRVERNTEAARR